MNSLSTSNIDPRNMYIKDTSSSANEPAQYVDSQPPPYLPRGQYIARSGGGSSVMHPPEPLHVGTFGSMWTYEWALEEMSLATQ